MPYQPVFTLSERRRVHSSEIDWADQVQFNLARLVYISLVETAYLALFPDTDRFTAQVGGEVAIAPYDIFAGNAGEYYWIASKAYDGSYLSIDAGTAPSDFADRAEVLHVPANGAAYLIRGDPVVFTSSGTFTKANYPGARAFRIECLGGGGGGGGVQATAAGEAAAGGGGGGGAYASSFVAATDMDTDEAVTVGAGGAGGGGAGSPGGDSVVDTIPGEVRAEGGSGGSQGANAVVGTCFANGGSGGGASGSTGNIVEIAGGDGGNGFATSASRVHAGSGGEGGGPYGAGRAWVGVTSTKTTGEAGGQWGAGASGAANAQSQTATSSQAGSQGIVIITPLF